MVWEYKIHYKLQYTITNLKIIQPWFLLWPTIGVDYGWSNIGSHHDLSDYSPTEWIKK